jgi:subtilisin family serine protease
MKRSIILIFTGLVMIFTVSGPPQKCPVVLGAVPSDVSEPSDIDSIPYLEEHGRGVVNAKSHRVAPRHILVQLHPRTDELNFLQRAKGQGLHRLGRVHGTRWLIMSIPEGAGPRSAAASARVLPGVLRATPDPIVHINDQIPPGDPLYRDDDDPSTKPCDPLLEICEGWDMVDQWGLFQVEAQGGWVDHTGSPNVVIAVLDSGVDLDHDDLWANIWTNTGETAGNGIDDDGNGFVDDVNGYDFCGDNVGDPYDDPTSEDANPDIPAGGAWVEDLAAWPFGTRFAGDPAVGDAVDNNMDYMLDTGVTHGTFVAGIAGAMTDNINPDTNEYEGMAGACWHVQMMPVRLINAEGWAYGSDAASAVYYATDNLADIINISWGIDLSSGDPSLMEEIQVLVDAINYAVAEGVIVVAAAGNSGTAGLHFPACMPNTIAVGASNWLDLRSEFSNFAALGEIPDNGIDDDGNGWVDDVLDVLAPGELIWSTAVLSAYDALLYDFLGMLGWEPGDDTYASADGTSFAAPLVSGYVGLILSQNPGATLSQVREVIRSNAVDVLDPHGVGDSLVGYDAYSGFGRMRMVVPVLTPNANQAPFAVPGEDQTVPDKGKPGEEKVTLDGSGSYDLDGHIIAYEWLENDQRIATGETATLKLPVGSNTITLRVTDDQYASGEGDVTITITPKNGDLPDEGGSSAPSTAMGVYEMYWSAKNNLDLTVNIRRDSSGDGALGFDDEPVSEAKVWLELTQAPFQGGTVQNSWTFQGQTDSSGNFRVKVPRAPAGHYQAEITGLDHDIHTWEQGLEVNNPDTFDNP